MVPLNHFIAAEQHIKWRKIWTNKSYHTHNALECQQISAHIEYSINQYAWLYATSGIFTYSVPVLNGLTRPTRKKKVCFFSAIPNWIQPAVSMTEGLRVCVCCLCNGHPPFGLLPHHAPLVLVWKQKTHRLCSSFFVFGLFVVNIRWKNNSNWNYLRGQNKKNKTDTHACGINI